jgi:hypothetical protein
MCRSMWGRRFRGVPGGLSENFEALRWFPLPARRLVGTSVAASGVPRLVTEVPPGGGRVARDAWVGLVVARGYIEELIRVIRVSQVVQRGSI